MRPVTPRAIAGSAATALCFGLAFIALVSIWTPLMRESIAERWFSTPNIFYLWPVPFVTALLALGLWKWLNDRREYAPFLATIGLFLLGYMAADAWPLTGVTDWDEWNSRILRGEPTDEPRLEPVPVRVPYPKHERAGSIYEVQSVMKKSHYAAVRP
jgi:hypothetical protein